MNSIVGEGKTLWDFCARGDALLISDERYPPIEECKGKIIITHMPAPDITLYMMEAKALIAETGGVLCHVAVLGLELGIPVVVAAEGVMSKILPQQSIFIEGKNGVGTIYV